MQVLENFLIGIGFKVDEKGAQDANQVLSGLSSSALQLGAVLAGKLALDKVIGDFNRLGVEAANFQAVTGTTPQKLDQMTYAFERVGGSASDAMGTIKNLQNLIASPMTGNVGWMSEAARFGIDPTQIISAQNPEEALLGLADQFKGLSLQQQIQGGRALGLDDSTIRLLQQGRGEIEKYYESVNRLGTAQNGDAKISSDYASAMQDVDRVFTDITRTIGRELTPAITELAKEFADWYADNREFIQGDLADALKLVAENLKPIVAAMVFLGGASTLKTMAMLLRLPGALMGARAAATAAGVAGAAGAGAAGAGAGTVAAAAGASTAVIAAGTVAALTYSSALNDGEDEEVAKIHQRQGATVPDEKKAIVMQYLQDKGWTYEQSAGITANLVQESSLNPEAKGDGGKAYGIAQWHPDRQKEFEKFTGRDIQGSTLQQQLDFLHYELTQGREQSAGNRLRETTSAREAGEVVSKYYERPKDKEGEAARRGLAAEQLAPYSDKKGSTSPATINDNRQYHMTGDPDTMRRILREEVGEMANRTTKEMQSPER